MGEKKGFFSRLVSGLTKTRKNIASGLDSIFHGFSKIDDDFYEELEEILIMGDLGVDTTMNIIEDLQERVKEEHIKEPAECRQLLIDIIKKQMEVDETAYEYENRTSVVLVIGVNGVGKTTTIGKLAAQLKSQNKKVIMAAADTFRAAAIEQLTEWSNRAGVDIIAQQEGSDPAAVIYDACQAAKSRHADVLLCDTAGRLHNKKNLMNELSKIRRVIEREFPEAYLETLIVLDGTTGQNALVQAKQFKEVSDISGIVLTKLDGTAKGGIAIAIQAELGTAFDTYKAESLDFTYADALKDYIDLMVKYSPDADKPEALVGVDYDSAMGGSFCIGKTAVIQMGQWVAPVIDEIDPELRENIGVLPMPLKGVDEDNICYGAASYFVVNKNSDDAKKAAAKDFVNWLLTVSYTHLTLPTIA